MSRSRLLGAAVVWLAVVASVSALVWVVISHAGQDLVSADQPLTATDGPASVTASREPSSRPRRTPTRTPSKRPSRTPSTTPSSTPSASATSTPGATSSATQTPTQAPTQTPTQTPTQSPSTSPTSPSSHPSAAGTEERRTWQGQAGVVVVACQGGRIRLVSAQPSDGFRAEVHDEDDLIDVEFEGREDQSGSHVKVEARCAGGVPSFSVRSEDD